MPDARDTSRSAFPAMVTFDRESFTVRDYLLDLEKQVVSLRTEHAFAPGANGRLKLRYSQFEEPVTVAVEVMKGEIDDRLELRLVDPGDDVLAGLRRVLDGVQSGSVVAVIRRAAREPGKNPEHVIRQRPADQKLMLALQAQNKEIEILIRDGHPSVMKRLLENPRLQTQHVILMLRNRQLPTRVLSAIARQRAMLNNDECRFLFVTHPATMLADAMRELPRLSRSRLQRLQQDANVRPQIRAQARELTKPKDFRRR